MLAQASMRVMGKYELGWLQALITQDAPDHAARLAPAPVRDDDEGTEGGIFIGKQDFFVLCPLPPCHWQPAAHLGWYMGKPRDDDEGTEDAIFISVCWAPIPLALSVSVAGKQRRSGHPSCMARFSTVLANVMGDRQQQVQPERGRGLLAEVTMHAALRHSRSAGQMSGRHVIGALCRGCEAVRAKGRAFQEGHLRGVLSREPRLRRLGACEAHRGRQRPSAGGAPVRRLLHSAQCSVWAVSGLLRCWLYMLSNR